MHAQLEAVATTAMPSGIGIECEWWLIGGLFLMSLVSTAQVEGAGRGATVAEHVGRRVLVSSGEGR